MTVRNRFHRVLGLTAAASLTLGAASITGCASYGSYPEIGSDAAVNDTNVIPMPTLMRLAVTEVAERYGYTDAPYLVNWPKGTEMRTADRMIELMPGDAARAMPGTLDRPTLHVTRVWLRVDTGTVEVLRPMLELGPKDDGTFAYEPVVVHLRTGALKPWRVVATRAWSPDTRNIPRVHLWEDEWAADEPMIEFDNANEDS
ncbi:MAG: hypothetical protein AAGD00_00515 [Planctomycetota bacterium]